MTRKDQSTKTASLKEAQARYVIEVDGVEVDQEVTMVQRDGKPVAAIVPIDDYRAFQEWQTRRSHPDSPEFKAEVAAFERLKPELLERYQGRAVAIHQGELVEVGDDKMDVLARVQERFGNVVCYVEWVEPDAPRRKRLSSAWIADQ